MHGFIIFSF